MSGQLNVVDNTVAAIVNATVEAMNKLPVTRAVLRRDSASKGSTEIASLLCC
jgi:hypothetical protein